MKQSPHYKKMPRDVRDAAKRALKGRWAGFKAGQRESDRLKDFLWWRPKGIYTPYRRADGKVVWPVLVGTGVLKKCYSREAAEKAAESNPDNVKRMEKLANLAGRLDDLEGLLGLEPTGWPQCMNRPSRPLQHFIVVDLHSGWRAMFVTEPQSKSLADADSRGGRKFYAKPLEFLQKIIDSAFLDLCDAAKSCVEINQCVGCTRQFFTKPLLGDGAAVLARSNGEEPASPRHRAGVASMAWRTTR